MKVTAQKDEEFYHCFTTGDLMKDDISIGLVIPAKAPSKVSKPGRPKAIPPELEPVVIELHRLGYGYRAIARNLRDEHHINPDFSTVRRTLIRLGIQPHQGCP